MASVASEPVPDQKSKRSKPESPGETVCTAGPGETVETMTTVVMPARQSPARPQSCPRCGSTSPWGAASWCPDCGYYPAFDQVQSEAEAEPDSGEGNAEGEAAKEPENLWQAIPTWAWVMGGGCLAILALTVAARLMIPLNSPYLALWKITQFVVGLIMAGIAQATAYFVAIHKNERLGPLDIVLKPVEIWRPTFILLPRTSRRVCLMAWGLTAMALAYAFFGGVDLDRLFEEDWVDPSAQRNLVHEIVKRAREERDDAAGSMEDAMNQFVGEEEPQDPATQEPALKTDCLIIGYTQVGPGPFSSILLASVPPGGELTFVGTLRIDELPEDIRETLADRMPTLRRSTPFVKTSYDATWLQPVITCRIAFDSWSKGDMLQGAQFSKMLGDVTTD